MTVRLISKPAVVRLASLAYRAMVLALYPAVFRAEYEQEMLDMFRKRCSEIYGSGGTAQVGRWLLPTFAEEFRNIYKEYRDIMAETPKSNRNTRGAMSLGIVFLIGTWGTIFFLANEVLPLLSDWMHGSEAGFLPGLLLVLINASFVVRAVTRSKRFEYVAGMAAISNIFLFAGLIAIHTGALNLSRGFEFNLFSGGMALLIQGGLIWMHGRLMWHMRGEDLIHTNLLVQTGG